MSQTITSEPNEDRLSKFENQILAHPIVGSVYKDVIGLLQRPAVPIIEVVGPKLACNHALYVGHDSLEMHDLGVSALTEDSLLQILQEILEGERSIEAARRRTDELRAKLGIKEVKMRNKKVMSNALLILRPRWRRRNACRNSCEKDNRSS